MWYVIQTETGREQELVAAIGRNPRMRSYERCFVILQECVWRIEGACKVYKKPLFPSYVFVETESPEQLFLALKQIPKMSRLLGNDGQFWAVRQEERELLCKMMGLGKGSRREEDVRCKNNSRWKKNGTQEKSTDGQYFEEKYLVRRSPVRVNGEGEILEAGGFLKDYMDRIVRKRLRKRSVTIEIPFLGEKRRIQIGIRVEGEEA